VGLALAVPVAVLVSVGISSGTGSSASGNQGAYLLRITRFTLMQAGLSTLLSVLIAIPLARALARRPRFRGPAVADQPVCTCRSACPHWSQPSA
jgi:thiamine transport system permease protein